MDIEVAHGGLLLQGFQIAVLESFCGTVGRSGSESLSTGNAADGCNVSASVLGHVVEHRGDASSESCAVSFHGIHLDFLFERLVLLSDAWNMKIEVNTVHLLHHLQELLIGLSVVNVDAGRDHLSGIFLFQGKQHFFSSGSHTHSPTLFQKDFSDTVPHSRRGSHDDGTSALHFLAGSNDDSVCEYFSAKIVKKYLYASI